MSRESHFDQRAGINPPGVACRCGRDYLTLTLEESCQPCPCTVDTRAEEAARRRLAWEAEQRRRAEVRAAEDEAFRERRRGTRVWGSVNGNT